MNLVASHLATRRGSDSLCKVESSYRQKEGETKTLRVGEVRLRAPSVRGQGLLPGKFPSLELTRKF